MTVSDPPQVAAARAGRLVELDVVRAVALIGVVFNNYYGYLYLRGSDRQPGGVLDFWTGWFSTRFATTFVLVAGIGTTLLAGRAMAGAVAERREIRWVLARRGVLLLVGGYLLDQVWAGTILPYYGLFFLAGAGLIGWSTRTLAIGAVVAAMFAAWVPWYVYDHPQATWPTGDSWSTPSDIAGKLLLNGTHPFFPWIAFFIVGMIIGRMIQRLHRPALLGTAVAALVLAYVVAAAFDGSRLQRLFTSTSPNGSADHFFEIQHGRPAGYIIATLAFAVAAFVVVGWIAHATEHTLPTRALAAAGRTTLTLYVGHALVFNVLVDWVDVIPVGSGSSAMATAAAATACYWVVGAMAAAVWQRNLGIGPLEWVYRRFSGR